MNLKQSLQLKRAEILAIATRQGAFNVRRFGSVARGEETDNNDIDFFIDTPSGGDRSLKTPTL